MVAMMEVETWVREDGVTGWRQWTDPRILELKPMGLLMSSMEGMSEKGDVGFRLAWTVVSFPFSKRECWGRKRFRKKAVQPCELEALSGHLCGDYWQIWNRTC